METVGVVPQDVGLRDVMGLADVGAFAVATAAEAGNFHGGSGRLGVRREQDVVRTVAGFAAWRGGVAARRRLPVEAGGVLGLLVGVARAAFHFGQLFGMREFFLGELGVAGGAFLVRVRGSFECSGVEWRRDAGLPFAHPQPGFMTAEAIVGVGERLGLLPQIGRANV